MVQGLRGQRSRRELYLKMIFEIRDYHYEAARLDAYREWSQEAVAVLGEILDLVGWWVDGGEPTLIMGSDPIDLPYGSANVTWMIRWKSMEQRERVWESMWEDEAWKACWERHPGFDGYLNMSVRFMEQVDPRLQIEPDRR